MKSTIYYFMQVFKTVSNSEHLPDGYGKGGQTPLSKWYGHFGHKRCIKLVCVTAFISVCVYRDVKFLHEYT